MVFSDTSSNAAASRTRSLICLTHSQMSQGLDKRGHGFYRHRLGSQEPCRPASHPNEDLGRASLLPINSYWYNGYTLDRKYPPGDGPAPADPVRLRPCWRRRSGGTGGCGDGGPGAGPRRCSHRGRSAGPSGETVAWTPERCVSTQARPPVGMRNADFLRVTAKHCRRTVTRGCWCGAHMGHGSPAEGGGRGRRSGVLRAAVDRARRGSPAVESPATRACPPQAGLEPWTQEGPRAVGPRPLRVRTCGMRRA